MTQQTLYPVFIGLLDLGFAGLLFLVVPVLGVLMGAIGALVVGTWLVQHLNLSPVESESAIVGNVR
ncbi:hypothetical protein [Halobellus salinus]|uniref:hypothetical protein n=1 Tax=Halobellus salinus TaxID=931585 RepID=UPI00166292C0|nr:hypothetical protein [Halobellus salinus]